MRGYANYLDLYRAFGVERLIRTRVGGGWKEEWKEISTLTGVLADASSRAAQIGQARELFVTHQVVEEGPASAAYDDRLTTDGRYFRVQFVENPGATDRYAIYSVTEEAA